VVIQTLLNFSPENTKNPIINYNKYRYYVKDRGDEKPEIKVVFAF
jgi:hypothetical protein